MKPPPWAVRLFVHTRPIRLIADSVTGVSERTPRKRGIWRRWILIPLWICQFLVVVQGFVRVYLDRVVEDSWDLKEGEWLGVLVDLVLVACLVLIALEVRAWRATTLRPWFYLQAQTFKTAFFTWHLYVIFKGSYARKCLKRQLYCPELVIHVVEISSFYLSFLYALYIGLLQRRRYAQVTQAELSERWAALLPPAIINSAIHPRSDSPTVVKLVKWVRDDPAWFSRLPRKVKISLSWTFYGLKYVIFVLPIIHLLAASERLPGEPPRKFTSDPPDLDDWNYPKAVTIAPEEYKDDDVRTTVTQPVNDEASIEALSLRTVEETILPATEVPEIEPQERATVTEAYGTSIDWDSLKMVDFKRDGNRMRIQWIFGRNTATGPLIFLIVMAVVSFAIGPVIDRHSEPRSPWAFASKVLPFFFHLWWTAVIVALPVPWLLAKHFQGKLLATQARMFGLSGQPEDLGDIERCVFGDNLGRLRWSDEAKSVLANDERPLFTLVDTFTCTATTFNARKPPVMLFVELHEQSMVTLSACSFEIETKSFVEEAGIKFEGDVSARFPKMDQFRFYKISDAETSLQESEALDSMDTPEESDSTASIP